MSESNPFPQLIHFTIPDAYTMMFLQGLEKAAMTSVARKIHDIKSPGGLILPGMPQTRLDQHQELKAYLHSLLCLPTLETTWTGASGSTHAMEGSVTPTSHMVTFLLFGEYGKLLKAAQVPEFIPHMDSLLLLGAHAVLTGTTPDAIYAQVFRADTKGKDGLPVIGAEEHYQSILKGISRLFCEFFEVFGLMERPGSPDSPWILNDLGRCAYEHLLSAISAGRSLVSQGPALMAATQAREAMRSAPAAMAAFINPDSEIPEV